MEHDNPQASDTGVSPLIRHLLHLMTSRMDVLPDYETYEQEALAANNLHALALIHDCRQADLEVIAQLRVIIGRAFLDDSVPPGGEPSESHATSGGGLQPREDGELADPVDAAIDESFPASDPPTYGRTSLG